jgi:hypothetical protein
VVTRNRSRDRKTRGLGDQNEKHTHQLIGNDHHSGVRFIFVVLKGTYMIELC